jgi:hypothetical protein
MRLKIGKHSLPQIPMNRWQILEYLLKNPSLGIDAKFALEITVQNPI